MVTVDQSIYIESLEVQILGFALVASLSSTLITGHHWHHQLRIVLFSLKFRVYANATHIIFIKIKIHWLELALSFLLHAYYCS